MIPDNHFNFHLFHDDPLDPKFEPAWAQLILQPDELLTTLYLATEYALDTDNPDRIAAQKHLSQLLFALTNAIVQHTTLDNTFLFSMGKILAAATAAHANAQRSTRMQPPNLN
jgi:hypothetical protein